MTIYTTLTEAIQREIIDAIEAGDASAEEFDIDAITDEVLEYIDGLGANPQYPDAIWMSAAGYQLRDLDEAEFWEIVAKHAN